MILLLLLLPTVTLSGCPDCLGWTGTVAPNCGFDGVTYDSDCDLMVSLCIGGTITLGDNTDINVLPVQAMVQAYKAHDGPCSGGGGSGNCPNCTSIVDAIPVCDSSLTAYNTSCAMARQMCKDGILSFDDGIDFSTMSETHYRMQIGGYVSWNGKCSGSCPPGLVSKDGNYGPCRECAPGKHAPLQGSTTCMKCPRDSYQPSVGSSSCLTCPNGTDTIDEGATSLSQCLMDCVPGHYSITGKSPCTRCSSGTFSDNWGSLFCKACGEGNFTSGVSCEMCPTGTFSNYSSASASCEKCAVGTFSETLGSTSCDSCAAGTFSNTTGLGECHKCGGGTYNNAVASTSCSPCDSGSYQIEEGSTFCYSCPQGTFQTNQGASQCTNCPVGSFQELEGSTACTICPDGKTTFTSGSGSVEECHFTSCDAGFRVVVVNNRITCQACQSGYYQNRRNQTSCIACPMDSFQNTEGSVSCKQCPENSVTYTEHAQEYADCEGPEIRISEGKSFGGHPTTIFDKRSQLPLNLRGKVKSVEVVRGDWYIFSLPNYGGTKIRLTKGVVRSDVTSGSQLPKIAGLNSMSFYSIRPVVTNSMCYNEKGFLYTGYRSKTRFGLTCQNWQSNVPHNNPDTYTGQGIGNHNYCRNPDNDPHGPWCYTTDPAWKWDYCGVPPCKWNLDCYTDKGQLYRGWKTKTSNNKYTCVDWYDDFPHYHRFDQDKYKKYGIGRHNYCRNPAPGDDNRPWCYTTNWLKRWSYCDVPKCEFSSIDYFTRRHEPKAIN